MTRHDIRHYVTFAITVLFGIGMGLGVSSLLIGWP